MYWYEFVTTCIQYQEYMIAIFNQMIKNSLGFSWKRFLCKNRFRKLFRISHCTFNFQGFDWEGLNGRCLVPPILPTVVGQADTSNFDKYPRDENVPADELSGWDKDF
jgi:hypothetical protein